jgi:hypothetical protein
VPLGLVIDRIRATNPGRGCQPAPRESGCA